MNISDILFEQPTVSADSFHEIKELPPDGNGDKGYKIYNKETRKLIRTFRGPDAATAAETFVDGEDVKIADRLRKEKFSKEKTGTPEKRKAIAAKGWQGLFKGKFFYKIVRLLTLLNLADDVIIYMRRYLVAYTDNGCSADQNPNNPSKYRKGKTVYDDMEWIRQRLADTFATIGIRIVTGIIGGALIGWSVMKILAALSAVLIAVSGGTLIIPVVGILLGCLGGYFVADVEKKFASELEVMGTTLGEVLFHFVWIDLLAMALPLCNEAAGLQKNNILVEQKLNEEGKANQALKTFTDHVNRLWDKLLSTVSRRKEKYLRFVIDKVKSMAS